MRCISRFLIPWASAVPLLLSPANAQQVHISHCMGECPDGAPASNEIVVRHLFAASISDQAGVADWVAYRVLADSVGVASLLPRYWLQDDLIGATPVNLEQVSQTNIAQPDLSDAQDRDYRLNEVIIESGDSGRLVPMSSFAGTPYWADLNYLSNMSPLPGDLRLGSWSRLDQAVNELALQRQELWVLSGPLYEIGSLSTTAGGAGNQPTAFFKVVADEDGVAAFVFSATLQQHVHYCDQLSSLAEVESRSGLHLFPSTRGGDSEQLRSALRCNN